MYLSDFVKVLIRQLPVVVIGVLCIGAAGVTALMVVPTNYQANAQVLFLPPSDPIPEGVPVNPYLNLPGNLTLTSSLIAGAVTTPDAQRALVDDGFESAYSTSVVPQTGPVIVVTVEDTDAAGALATRDEVVQRIAAELRSVQEIEGVQEEQMIVAREFGSSSEAEVLAGNRLRALGMILVVGSVSTVLAAFGIERWRTMRRERRARSVPSSAATPSGDTGIGGAIERPDVGDDPESDEFDFDAELQRVGELPEVR